MFLKLFQKTHQLLFQLSTLGRLEKSSNLDPGFCQNQNNNSILTIVGDGRERTGLESLAKDLKIEDRVVFTGFQAEPSQYLSQSDLYVLPSYSEGFGIAAIEAMFLKIPVWPQKLVACCRNSSQMEKMVGYLTRMM